MFSFSIDIANLIIHIDCRYRYTYSLCSAYIVDNDNYNFAVSVDEEDIAYEKDSLKDSSFSIGYIESLAIHRKIAERVIDYNRCLIHGASVGIDNKGFLFLADSGTGKSTHIKLWLDNISSAYVINGDKPLLIFNDDDIYVCGTPWCGKEGLSNKLNVPLRGIVLLNRGLDNSIDVIDPSLCFESILRQIYIPKDRDKLNRTIEFIKDLSYRVPLYNMFCNMDKSAAYMAYRSIV